MLATGRGCTTALPAFEQADGPMIFRSGAAADLAERLGLPVLIEEVTRLMTTERGRPSRERTDKLGVHNVTIALTDEAGNPLGSTDTLPVRAAQVSQVIWLVMGVAVALLFVAIVLRLVRRIRGTGSGGDDGGDDPDAGPAGDTGGALAEPGAEPRVEPVPALRGDP